MSNQSLDTLLNSAEELQQWCRRCRLRNVQRAKANLKSIIENGISDDLLEVIRHQLEEHLPNCPDPDMALNNLDRFFAANRNPLGLASLFERDPQALPPLLQIFSTSQYLSDLLVADPEAYDLLRLSEGRPSTRQALIDEITAEVAVLQQESSIMDALRRFRHRELLRIAYGDIVLQQSLITVTAQLSYLADAIVEAAFRAAWRMLTQRRGVPRRSDGEPARFVVLGMGKLGGLELNYSSDIDLIFIYEEDGETDGSRPISNREFFSRLSQQIVHFLTEPTSLGIAYRVDLRLRPEGSRGPICISVADALHYYDTRGRTWERQAYIKARPIAGHTELGYSFLQRLTPWIYRRYLSRADIDGIKTIKRKIEQSVEQRGQQERNVKTGRGGIRDIEFAIQFLQLLNGGDLPAIRVPNTLEAIMQLSAVGCLTQLERQLLTENYIFLRKIEHRLQVMFDLQTHTIPEDEEELRKLALRMGYSDTPSKPALQAFLEDYDRRRSENRRILRHLLHDAFSGDEATVAEVDLVLDPEPTKEMIENVLGKYGFRDPHQAYQNLMQLAEERIPFLSTRRCRHFLASIAPRLLEALAATPDPDSTLINLGQVTDSLGGKGVLWELFSFNPPSLHLYVELCAYSPFLCSILISNPGMIDSLMDSLVLDKLPSPQWLRETLAELCRGAEDLDPILHSFKNDQVLRVGIRDLLGKEDVADITRALSDIAETCLEQIAAYAYHNTLGKFGEPIVAEGPRAGQPAELIVLALGKFGGRELSYNSDLDLVFLFDADGQTVCRTYLQRCQATTNQHFFSELSQRIIRMASRLTSYGQLYQIDVRLRPTGRSGLLAVSLDQFRRYFVDGSAQLWERQALCRARVLLASPNLTDQVNQLLNELCYGPQWQPNFAREIRDMRRRLEEAGRGDQLKRAPGGLVDIEFLVQAFQLKFGPACPKVRQANTLAALDALYQAGFLARKDYELFADGYRFLRMLENKLQLVNPTLRDRLPEDETEVAKVAHLARLPGATTLCERLERTKEQVRKRFDQLMEDLATK